MKKILSVFALVAALVLCMTAFAGCTPDVDGKTYVFDSLEIELTDEGKEMIESMGMTIDESKEMAVEEYEGMEFSFADGTIDFGDGQELVYTQDGGDIIIYDDELFATVKGNKLIMEHSDELGTHRVIFVQK